MIPEKFILLMNGEIDGVNSPEETAELETYLDRDPAADTYFRELRDTVGIFDEVQELTPPAGLRERILGAVDDEVQPAPVYRLSFRDRWRRHFRPGYAFAGAAGIILGMLVLYSFGPADWGSGKDPNGWFRGSQLVYSGEAGSLEPVLFQAEGVDGAIRAGVLEDGLLIDLELDSTGPAGLALHFDAPLRCTGFRLEPGARWSLHADTGRVEVLGQGRCRGTLLITGDMTGNLTASRTVRWALTVNDEPVATGELPIPLSR